MYKYLLSIVTALALGVVLLTPTNAEATWRRQVYYPAYGYQSRYVAPYPSYYGRPYSYGYSPYGYSSYGSSYRYAPYGYNYGYSPYGYNYSPYSSGYGYRPGGVGFSFYVR